MEIERNLKKKMPRALSVYQHYLPHLNLKIIPVPRAQELREFAHTIVGKDLPVLVAAIQGKADFLVTGEKQHFHKLTPLKEHPLQIVTPAEFVDCILPEILKEMGQME
jgi:predicted nucleic acid-binding protein